MQPDIFSIEWDRFTGRGPARLDMNAVRPWLRGRRVLVTGAGGFIGSALALALAEFAPAELLLLDHAETGLEQLGRSLEQAGLEKAPRLVVGSITDAALLHEVFSHYAPEIVFHAAACKHVPLMEENPFAAAATNVLGTQRLCAAAATHGAEQVVLLSTDKAVEPRSIMGATKRVAELIVLCGGSSSMNTARFAAKVVRLGNVLGSTGSVGPLFAEQAVRGEALTVTDPAATRYFLSLRDAVSHLLNALTIAPAPALLVPDLGVPRSLVELARFVAGQMAGPDVSRSEPKIVFTGLRPGDKLVETLFSSDELVESSMESGPSAALRRVQVPLPPTRVVEDWVARLERAIATRALPELLAALRASVPSFEPSRELQNAASSAPYASRRKQVQA